MIICVTGKTGCGKSTFAKNLSEKIKFNYIDVDKIGHEIYENEVLKNKLFELFGKENIVDENGKIQRIKIGEIIFKESNEKKAKIFNDITWKYISNILEDKIDCNVVLDWFMLPKTKYWDKSDVKILIKPENDEERLNQIIKRDNITKEYAVLRNKNALNYDNIDFDFVIVNNYQNDVFENYITHLIKIIGDKK